MNILIVSESFMVRDSIGHLFNDIFQTSQIEVVAIIDDLVKEKLSVFDFIFIDINKENMGILETLSDFRKDLYNIKIMLLDFNKDREIFIKSTKLGVEGYILNIYDKEEFVYIVNKIISGKKYYDSELLQFIVSKQSSQNIQKLTSREIGVLKQVAKGYSNRDIAQNLNVTDFTIKKHVSKILSKLNLRNRQEIIIYARDNGLLIEEISNI